MPMAAFKAVGQATHFFVAWPTAAVVGATMACQIHFQHFGLLVMLAEFTHAGMALQDTRSVALLVTGNAHHMPACRFCGVRLVYWKMQLTCGMFVSGGTPIFILLGTNANIAIYARF